MDIHELLQVGDVVLEEEVEETEEKHVCKMEDNCWAICGPGFT